MSALEGISSQTRGRIVLVRHARSAHAHTGWIDAAGFRAWRESYEAAGIHEGERAPAALQQLVADADLLLSSDAPRALATARMLGPAHEIIVSRVLRELDLDSPHLGRLRLPLAAWALLVGVRIALLTLRGQHPSPAEAARIDEAARWIGELSTNHPLIVAVTHGSFRRELARRLQESGWQSEQRQRSIKHWSAWSFRRRPDNE